MADAIDAVRPGHPTRVAIDGPDAAGKTTLGNELAEVLQRRGRSVERASIDGFHRPRAERYRQGADSPRGYYEDSFDYAALRAALLDPLGPNGDRRIRRAVFDFRQDVPVQAEWETLADDCILVFDGVFLLRPELIDVWDVSVFVDSPFEETLRRARQRDTNLFGDPDAVESRYRVKYIPGQELYFAAVEPQRRATMVWNNRDPANPTLLVCERPGGDR